jgi:hypothetical protein
MYIIILTHIDTGDTYKAKDAKGKVLKYSTQWDAVEAKAAFVDSKHVADVQYQGARTRRGGKPAR